MSRVVLVTGVSRDLGGRVARALATSTDREAADYEVIGFDAAAPRRELGSVQFLRGDVRSPSFQGVLSRYEVDTLVHCGLAEADPTTSWAQARERNLLAGMQLVAACQKAPRLRRLIIRSSGQVYGSSPLDPVRFDEDTAPRRPPHGGVGKEASELEVLVSRLARSRPDLTVTALRLGTLIGGGVDSDFTRWLNLPVVPRPLGFDARLQFLHPADAVDAMVLAVGRELPGIFNVAAADVLTLTQVLRILGRATVPVWHETPGLRPILRRTRRIRFTSDDLRGVTWGRLLDTGRLAAAGFVPHYSSRRAVEEFAALGQPGLLSAERVEGVLDGVARILSPRPASPRSESPRP